MVQYWTCASYDSKSVGLLTKATRNCIILDLAGHQRSDVAIALVVLLDTGELEIDRNCFGVATQTQYEPTPPG
jgi:hypothetical protein